MNALRLLQIRLDLFKSQNLELDDFDVIFDIGGKKIYAHKFMLKSVSTTFASMISDRWASKDEPIIIDTYGYDDFYQFLTFLYSGECQLTNDNIFTMIDIAEFYQVQIFKSHCEEYLTKIKCNLENLFQLLDIANKYSLDKLNNSLAVFIKSNFSKIFNSDHFFEIRREILNEIFVMKRLLVEYEDIFEKVYEWAEKLAILKKESDPNFNLDETVKEILSDFLRFFDFAKMDIDFVIKFIVGKSLLPPSPKLSEILSKSCKLSKVIVNITDDQNSIVMKGKFVDHFDIFDDIQGVNGAQCKRLELDHHYWETTIQGRPFKQVLQKRNDVEWYLVYDSYNNLALKSRNAVDDSKDYLIAEMCSNIFIMNSGFRIFIVHS